MTFQRINIIAYHPHENDKTGHKILQCQPMGTYAMNIAKDPARMFCVASSWEGVCVWIYLLSICVLFLSRVAVPGKSARHTDIFLPPGGRSAFTHKKTLNRLHAKSANTTQDVLHDDGQPRSSRRQPAFGSSRVYQKFCNFCEKSNKCIKRCH